LPALPPEQVNDLIEQADNLRDKAIISLFADSGMRLSELASVKPVVLTGRTILSGYGVKEINKEEHRLLIELQS